MKKKILDGKKGVTTPDVIIAIIILIAFGGVVGTLYYNIIYDSNMVKLNSIAVHYAIKLAEDVDKIEYENINKGYLENYITENYDLPNRMSINIDVENYNEENVTKEDILKIVTINVEYYCIKNKENFELRKLKVKEM